MHQLWAWPHETLVSTRVGGGVSADEAMARRPRLSSPPAPLGVPVAVLRCRQTHAGVYGPCVHSCSKLTPEQRPQTLGHEVSRPVGGGGLALGHTLPSEPASVGSKAGPAWARHSWASAPLSAAAWLHGKRAAHPAALHRHGRRPAAEAARLLPGAPDHGQDCVNHQP